VLTASGLSKAFGGARALSGVDFEVQSGEIHALVGENGAGKSTLIKILSGIVVADAGDVQLDSRRVPAGDPAATRRMGVSCVHQEFALVPALSVADNLFLGRERGPLLRRREMNAAADALLGELGLRVPARALVHDLSVAHQQLVEIARALADDARVLILDEPTATLPDPDIERLFGVLRRLRQQGLGIVYISHRLEEVFAIADRITVLRDGQKVGTWRAGGIDRADLIRHMVGRTLTEEFPARTTTAGDVMLELDRLAAPPRFDSATLAVREGEIVGLAGLVGAGRTSVGLATVGALRSTGSIRLHGQPVRFGSPSAAISAGLAYVTEDRKRHGLFPQMDAAANITMTFLASFARAGWLSRSQERTAAEAAARDYHVRGAGLDRAAATLSGGNQQKLLLARFLLQRRAAIILDEPTRGVDVGARAEIYRIMNGLTAQGLGILMISSDLNEVLGMSDRIVVMREGRTVGELARQQASAERVMALAAGVAA
jgi:ribose transport system ATP-binding protein/rhamnose transport system ATP-binding protein